MRTSLAAILLMTGCGSDEVASPQSIAAPAAAPAEGRGPRFLAPADPAASILSFPELQGRWRVTAVALADGPVQAYRPDDPAYLGAVMLVDGKTLAWEARQPATSANLADRCEGAATMRVPPAAAAGIGPALARLGARADQAHEVACLAGGGWGGDGGGALLFPAGERDLVMRWYDGVVLKLEWIGR